MGRSVARHGLVFTGVSLECGDSSPLLRRRLVAVKFRGAPGRACVLPLARAAKAPVTHERLPQSDGDKSPRESGDKSPHSKADAHSTAAAAALLCSVFISAS
ncbi:hypothetical protein LBMAG56_01930 [Verrucomicrobiota bacterium]|nr:hypothetical protein LBMAG56_01930 [Verrucomicrobiota bacterium]